jgi:hypothetical protein
MPTRATWIAAGVGVASLGVGAYYGFAARSLLQDSRRGCDQTSACSDAAFAANQRSHRDAMISTSMFAAAGVALVTTAVLYGWSPRERVERVQVAPILSAKASGLAVTGGF